MSTDTVNWNCTWGVRKFDEDAVAWLTDRLGRTPSGDDFAAAGIAPYEDSIIDRNLLTTAGLTRITSLIVGGGGQAADNTHARLGVGDGTTAVAIGDTDFSASAGSTHRWFQVMDASKPTTSAGVITFQSTFASGDGNFHWQEFGVDITSGSATSSATVGATLLNHKLSDQGTKTSGQSWTATATITLS
jgi:hypothetical protein